MRRIRTLLLLIFATATLASCSKVPAGHVGIKVYLLGKEKGVDHEELSTGRYWIGINEELYLYPTYTQNWSWTANSVEGSENDESISFQTKDGLKVSGDFGIIYTVDPEKVSVLFTTYRRGIEEITDGYLRKYVRDALNKYSSQMKVEDVYGKGKIRLLDSVNAEVARQVRDKGIIVERISPLNEFMLPDNVEEAINNKIEATQRAQQREFELREAEAEAQKTIAKARGDSASIVTKAAAEAEANRLLSKSITKVLVQYEAAKRWNGKYPQTMLGESNLIMSLGK